MNNSQTTNNGQTNNGDPCASVACDAGEACDPESGQCVAVDLCGGVTCEPTEACEPASGHCVAVCEVDCQPGAGRCGAGGAVETCAVGPEGCASWAVTARCGGRQVCTATGGSAVCACAASCEPGRTRCEGASLEACVADADGCAEFEVSRACDGLAPARACGREEGVDLCPTPRVATAAPGAHRRLEGYLDGTARRWARPNEGCQPDDGAVDHLYEAWRVFNDTDAAQSLTVTATWTADGYLHAFRAPFDPNDLGACLAGNDDQAPNATGSSQLSALWLAPGEGIVVVASTYDAASAMDAYSLDLFTGGELVGVGCDGADATVVGSVTFDDRPISANGLGRVVAAPLLKGTAVLLVDGQELGSVPLDGQGGFCFSADVLGQQVSVRVEARQDLGGEVSVTDFDRAVYAVESAPFTASSAPRPIHIDQASNAGGFAILNTMGSGRGFARSAFGLASGWPAQSNHWERGNTTPGGTSYFAGSDGIWILGGPQDTDEYDVAVLMHELGHYIEAVFRSTDGGQGSPHAGADTDPRLAWSEGWATHFSTLARGSSLYFDSFGDRIGLAYDVATLPASGEYVGRPQGGLSQDLSEWLIAASLWRLYVSGDPELQASRLMGVIRDWFEPQVTDRGAPGADFVDFLDGYLCLYDNADLALIQSHIVTERTFPYDFGGECPALKPGRPRLKVPLDVSELPDPAGKLVVDARGRLLRLVALP